MTWYGMAWQNGTQSLGTLFRVSIRLTLTSTFPGFSGGLQNFVWHYRKIDRSLPPLKSRLRTKQMTYCREKIDNNEVRWCCSTNMRNIFHSILLFLTSLFYVFSSLSYLALSIRLFLSQHISTHHSHDSTVQISTLRHWLTYPWVVKWKEAMP